MFSLNYVGVSVRYFIVLIFGLNTKKLHFLGFELHTIMCIMKYLVSYASEMFVLNTISNFEALMRVNLCLYYTLDKF